MIMNELIRKILKEESLKQTLKDQIKEFGWKDAAGLVGDGGILAKLVFNNDPVEFLNLFNDLDVVQSEKERNWTLFRYKKGDNLIVYNRKTKYVYISYSYIWLFLESHFGLNNTEIKQLTQEWLADAYNLREVTTNKIIHFIPKMLADAYNLRGVTTKTIEGYLGKAWLRSII